MKTRILKNRAAVFAVALGLVLPSLADRTISENITLTADADWTGDGLVTLSGNPTIDLAGYTLKVHSIAGTGEITSSNTDFQDLTTTDGLTSANKFIWASTNGVEVTLAGTGGNGVDGSKYPAERAFDNIWGSTKINITPGGEQNYSFLYYGVKSAFWNGSNTFELNYKFDSATTVKGYRIYPYSSAANAGYPKSWTFEGSSDGITWTELDSCANQTLSKGTWYSYALENDAEFQYYRLRISQVQDAGNTRVDIGEMEIGILPSNKLQIDGSGLADCNLSGITISDAITVETEVADGESITLSKDLDLSGVDVSIAGTIDLAGYTLTVNTLTGGGTITDTSASTGFTDLTSTNGLSEVNKFIWASTNGVEVVMAGAGNTGNAGNGVDGSKYPAERAFDNDLCNSQIVVGSNGTDKGYAFAYYQVPSTFDWSSDTYELNYRFAAPTLVNRYRIYPFTPGSVTSGSPTKWTFEGSDDGIAWTELDSRSGQSLNNKTWYDFDTFNTKAYTYYRLRVKGVKDSSKQRADMGELEFGCRHEPGKVVVNVPTGKTVENTDVTISGNVRLVKDGLGTLVASKASQTNLGGTEVLGGTLKPGTTGAGLLGLDGSEIRVKSGGTFDVNGLKGSIGKYAFTLDGGCLAQTVAMTGDTTANYEGIVDIALKDDATFDAAKNMYLGSSTSGIDSHIDLGGKKFSGTIGNGQYLRFQGVALENGTFEVTGNGGYLLARGGVVATNVDFKLSCAVVIRSGELFAVRDYEALGGTRSTSTQSGTMAVYGTFTPTSDSFYGCTLMDGATLDLSTRSTTLNPYSDFTAGSTTLKFEANATINIHLGTRKTSGAVPLLSWTAETKPDNIDTVKFVRADEGRRYALVVKENGLYACAGLIISFH